MLDKNAIAAIYTSDDLYTEAESVEEYGEWIHENLMGYSSSELRAIAKQLEEKETER